MICILDCCFSGQAPARVLGSVARPRNALTLTGVHGEGRILLAACDTKESAWEQPGTGHGLLTHGVIQALTKAAGESVSFPEIAGEIVRLTRVEAERLAVTQTPIFLGHVQGWLTFPVLKRGDNFAAAFPAVAIHRMSRSFTEFVNHGLPQEIVDQWQSYTQVDAVTWTLGTDNQRISAQQGPGRASNLYSHATDVGERDSTGSSRLSNRSSGCCTPSGHVR